VSRVFLRIVERGFVDSTVLHRWWHCHRLPDRSFRLNGRQFHVCARCTGIIVGATLSPFFILLNQVAPAFLGVALVLVLGDAGSQLLGIRTSTNALRFTTGAALGLSALPALVNLIT
jgi:uncharacterized membrane protein